MAMAANRTAQEFCGNVTQTCLVLSHLSTPLYSESVAAMHFAMSALALICAAGFIWNVSMAKTIMLHLGTKEPTDRISFYVAPLLCCVFCFCSLVHGLSCMPIANSPTFVPGKHIGCECVAGLGLQEARYALHSLVMPLLLLVAFEQSYVIHKRKTAKFCCIGFDRGHRLKNTEGLKCVSRLLRYSMWVISAGLLVFNCIMNARVIESTRGGSNAYLLKQRRFTTKGMLRSSSSAAGGGGMNPQAGDLVEYIIVVTFTFYFGLSLWNYGKNFSMKMTAMPCNRWMAMLFGSLQLLVLSLLPDTFTVFTADLSVVLYMLTMILLQREVLLDLTKLMDYDKNSKRSDIGDGMDSSGISLGNIEDGGASNGMGSLPSWALGSAMAKLESSVRAEVYLIEEMEKSRHPYTNPLRTTKVGGGGESKSVTLETPDRPQIKPQGEVGVGAIARLKAMHAKNVKFRPLAPNYVAALAKAKESADGKAGEVRAAAAL